MPRHHLEQEDAGSPSLSDQSRKTCKTDKTRWLIAIAASLALNGTASLLIQATPENIGKVRQTISFLIQETGHKISSTLNAFTQSREEQNAKTDQLNTWRNALKKDPNLPGFDYGDFFLELSWLEGHISEETLKKDQQKLAELIKRYQELTKKPSEGFFSILGEMIEKLFGKYAEGSAQLHPLLSEGKGNCNARIQMMISLIKGVYGDKMPMKARVSRQKTADGRDQLHSDLLIQIYDKWHIVEPELPETTVENLEGTAIFEVSDYVKTYIEEEKPKSDVVKPGKTPNKNKLDSSPTDALVDLANNVDPEKLKTHEQKHPGKTSGGREPIEMTVIPRDSQVATTIPPTKDQPKRQLTSQEVVEAALAKAIRITPDIESLEPLRGIPLDGIFITNTEDNNPDKLTSADKWPSFEPLAETPPKEILIAEKTYYLDNQGQMVKLNDATIPDLSQLYGKTIISDLLIDTNDLQEWEKILQNFTIQEASIYIAGFTDTQITLKPLTNAKITKSLLMKVVAREGTIDFTGIDSLTPPELNMSLFIADQKLLNPEALERVHFTTFRTSDHALDSGVLDGVTIQTNTLEFVVAPYNPTRRRYLKDTFRTRRVEIFDEEAQYSETVLEPIRGMPPLDFLRVEMKQHEEEEHSIKYGHMSFDEIKTGEKPNLDISPLKETPIADVSMCGGYHLISTIPMELRNITIVNSPADPEAVEKWREHLRTLSEGESVPKKPKDSTPVPATLQELLEKPKL